MKCGFLEKALYSITLPKKVGHPNDSLEKREDELEVFVVETSENTICSYVIMISPRLSSLGCLKSEPCECKTVTGRATPLQQCSTGFDAHIRYGWDF